MQTFPSTCSVSKWAPENRKSWEELAIHPCLFLLESQSCLSPKLVLSRHPSLVATFSSCNECPGNPKYYAPLKSCSREQHVLLLHLLYSSHVSFVSSPFHPVSSSPAQVVSMLLPCSLLVPAFAAIPIHASPSSAYTISPYPSFTAFPFIPQNLTSFTQPSSPNNFTTDGPYLEVVHEICNLTTFPTGVAVDEDDRIFINFPRSASSNDVTLGLADSFNTTAAYPNASIQTCQRGQNVSTCFVNLQSVVIDSAQRIWALDTGVGPGQTDAVEYGAKIMSFNLTTNEMIDNYVLPYSISANGTRYTSLHCSHWTFKC